MLVGFIKICVKEIAHTKDMDYEFTGIWIVKILKENKQNCKRGVQNLKHLWNLTTCEIFDVLLELLQNYL